MKHKILSIFINPLSIITLFVCFNNSASIDPNFTACEPKSCGDSHNITFPFWINGVQDSMCGLPGFNVSCKDTLPIIKLSDDKHYVIEHIEYRSHSLRVYSTDVLASANSCIQYAAKNLTLDSDYKFQFNDSNVSNLFLYFNCSLSRLRDTESKMIGCNDTGLDFATFVSDAQYREVCPQILEVPVELSGNDRYQVLMRRGFGLKWVARNCSECVDSGGHCGYIAAQNDYRCFCPDRPHKWSCKPGKKKWKLIVPIVISAAAAVVILPLVLIFLQRRHNRRKESSSNLLARNISNDPYSKSELERGNVYFGIPIFPYSELEEATNHFDPAKELGDGGFGTVYYGKLRDGREVAVKRLYENNCKRVEQFMNEIKILTLLRHQNLVSLYGCTSRHSRELLLVYEYISNGTVADHLHGEMANPSPLTWPVRMSIAIETARALAYLHASDIIHRDVKTNNILLDNKFSVKVADFGLSRLFPTAATHVSTAPQGTPGYVDPEYHQCYQLTEKSDVFSFGVVLIELLSSMQAVDITRHRQEINLANLALNRIQNQAFDELIDSKLGFNLDSRVTGMTIAVAELAFRCLQHDKEMRPSMQEVLDDLLIIDSQDYDEDETDGVKKAQPHLHDSDDDASLLKKMRLRPVSPTSVAEKWISTGSTISSVGG